jgi:N-acetyl-gamma-glutamyl-phosphate reductase
MTRIGIVGGTGYTGSELLRILATHPSVRVSCVTSRADAGQRVDAVAPSLRGYYDLRFEHPDSASLAECELVFFATPNGTAMREASALLDAGVRVIDLAADFRIKDVEVWQQWYGMRHEAPGLVDEAVYGLPEVNRDSLRTARLVANPGCYPTAVTLGLLPLLESGLADPETLIADAKSGVSGAGRKASTPLLMSEAGESFKAYSVNGHRHAPEIEQTLGLAGGRETKLTFVPHLVPMIRGIEATLYARLTDPGPRLAAAFREALRVRAIRGRRAERSELRDAFRTRMQHVPNPGRRAKGAWCCRHPGGHRQPGQRCGGSGRSEHELDARFR